VSNKSIELCCNIFFIPTKTNLPFCIKNARIVVVLTTKKCKQKNPTKKLSSSHHRQKNNKSQSKKPTKNAYFTSLSLTVNFAKNKQTNSKAKQAAYHKLITLLDKYIIFFCFDSF